MWASTKKINSIPAETMTTENTTLQGFMRGHRARLVILSHSRSMFWSSTGKDPVFPHLEGFTILYGSIKVSIYREIMEEESIWKSDCKEREGWSWARGMSSWFHLTPISAELRFQPSELEGHVVHATDCWQNQINLNWLQGKAHIKSLQSDCQLYKGIFIYLWICKSMTAHS